MRPIARDDGADLRVDMRDATVEPGFDLLPDHLQLFGFQRPAMQEIARIVRAARRAGVAG